MYPAHLAVLLFLLLAAWGGAHASPSVIDQVVDAACEKELVLLGELPSHGEARGFDAKAKIVRQLVERCGFDAVLFEAPMYEFETLRSPASDASPSLQELENAIGRFWTTQELSPWRAWLLEQVVQGRVRVGGIDDQPSDTAVRTTTLLPEAVTRAVPGEQASSCREALQRHLRWSYSKQMPFDAAEKARLLHCAEAALADTATVAVPTREDGLIRAFRRYARRLANVDGAGTRDDAMRETLTWHVDALPRGSRVMVWTATVHAARQPGGLQDAPFGQALAEHYGDRMFTVGFTAAGGTSSRAGGAITPLEPAPADALESLALGGSIGPVYVDKRALERFDGSLSRLYGRFTRHPWSRHFDAVVVFREEHAPTFPPRERK